jgi:hypothetical protein
MIEKVIIIFFIIAGIIDFKYKKVPLWMTAISFIAILTTKSLLLITISAVFLPIYLMNNIKLKFGYIDFNLMLYIAFLGIISGLKLDTKYLIINIIGIFLSLVCLFVYKNKYKDKELPIVGICIPILIANLI